MLALTALMLWRPTPPLVDTTVGFTFGAPEPGAEGTDPKLRLMPFVPPARALQVRRLASCIFVTGAGKGGEPLFLVLDGRDGARYATIRVGAGQPSDPRHPRIFDGPPVQDAAATAYLYSLVLEHADRDPEAKAALDEWFPRNGVRVWRRLKHWWASL